MDTKIQIGPQNWMCTDFPMMGNPMMGGPMMGGPMNNMGGPPMNNQFNNSPNDMNKGGGKFGPGGPMNMNNPNFNNKGGPNM